MVLGPLAVEWKRIKGNNETKGRLKSPGTEFEDSKSDAKLKDEYISLLLFLLCAPRGLPCL